MNIEERKILSQKPIIWTGDLLDDCTAEWAGLMLRAEWMDDDYWWWAVYDMQKDEVTVDDSNQYTNKFIGVNSARQKAEDIAKQYIKFITTHQITAKYLISETFKITGRGIAFAGYITEGLVSINDTIEFTTLSYLIQRKITGIEGIRKSQPDKVNTGLLIKCNSEAEIEYLKNWKPDQIIATIYKSESTNNH